MLAILGLLFSPKWFNKIMTTFNPISNNDQSLDQLSRQIANQMAELVLQDVPATTPVQQSKMQKPTNEVTKQLCQNVATTLFNERESATSAATTSASTSCPSCATEALKEEKEFAPATQSRTPVRVIQGAHYGNIQAIAKLSEGFVTGGQDARIIRWSDNGTLLARVWEPPKNSPAWVTVIGVLDPETWFSGTRNGWINLRRQEDDSFTEIMTPCSAQNLGYKESVRNFQRIICFLPRDGGKEFLVGRPGRISCYKASCKSCGWLALPADDWVSALHSLGHDDFLAAVGPELIWFASSLPGKWYSRYRRIPLHFVQNNISDASRNKQFISSMVSLASRSSLLALGLLNGTLKIYDFDAQKIVSVANAHSDRIWSIINLSNSLFASASGDGSVKLWDARAANRPCMNIAIKGRVTVLVPTGETQFVSGSSSYASIIDTTAQSKLSFWDLRK
jgi:hypothetical protein